MYSSEVFLFLSELVIPLLQSQKIGAVCVAAAIKYSILVFEHSIRNYDHINNTDTTYPFLRCSKAEKSETGYFCILLAAKKKLLL